MKHCNSKKHDRKSKYECKECAYITFKKADYTRHLLNNKHKKNKSLFQEKIGNFLKRCVDLERN